MTLPRVAIAVVGHTNTGKTSLMRTLLRDADFGEVSDRPATTRDVRGGELLAGGDPVALFDTPGLEDAPGVAELIAARHAPGAADPVAAIESFLAGDHGAGRYEQEAKVLRQVLRSDAALYVVDAREPVLAKHREELKLLAACGRPIMPVLNFVADGSADVGAWKSQLARLGLHVTAEFDTVVYLREAEHALFEKLATLLEARRATFERLLDLRDEAHEQQLEAACRAIGELLCNAAGARARGEPEVAPDRLEQTLQDAIRGEERRCVDALLELYRFDLGAFQPPSLPLENGRWALDLFDPETVKGLGLRVGGGAAAGATIGLVVDALTLGASLGAAAAIGGALGAGVGAAVREGRDFLNRRRGYQELALMPDALAALAARQVLLLAALRRRGHASTDPLSAAGPGGWPSTPVRDATLRCRSHPEWSALNTPPVRGTTAEEGWHRIAEATRALFD